MNHIRGASASKTGRSADSSISIFGAVGEKVMLFQLTKLHRIVSVAQRLRICKVFRRLHTPITGNLPGRALCATNEFWLSYEKTLREQLFSSLISLIE